MRNHEWSRPRVPARLNRALDWLVPVLLLVALALAGIRWTEMTERHGEAASLPLEVGP